MTELDVHPAALLFPLLDGEEYEAFKLDIAEHGLIEAIWLCEGKILDGRNRYRACCALGIEPKFREYDGDSPVAFVWSLNGRRRQLSKSQLAMIAAKMLGPLKEEAKKRQLANLMHQPQNIVPPEPVERETQTGEAVQQAAKLVGVGKTVVQDAKAIIEQAPDLVESVEAGQISVDRARKIMKARPPSPDSPRQSREIRIAQIKQLAAEGHRAEQISAVIGISTERIRVIANAEHITLPDAAIGSVHKINVHRVVEETVHGLAGYASGLQLISDLRDIDRQEAIEWATSLAESMRSITSLRKRLLEVANEQTVAA